MKLFSLAFSFILLSLSFGQINDPLNKWPGEMSDDKRSIVADEIIFTYKYASPETIDSIENVINQSVNLSAWNHLIKSEFDKARSEFSMALDHLDITLGTSESTFLSIRAHTNKAKLLTITNKLSEALNHFSTALSLSKGDEYAILRAKTYAALGEFYRKTNDFEFAFDYLDSAQLIVNENLIYDEVNIDILDRKSALFSQIGPVDSMLYYSHQALSMAQDQQNLHAQAVSHNELGYYFEHEPNWDSSYFHYDKAIDIWTKTGALRYLANAQINKSRLLMKDQKFGTAKDLLFNTLEFSEDKGWYELYPQLYEHICVVYTELGDSLNLYKYQVKKVQAYFDKHIIETEKTILQMESQIELNKLKDTVDSQREEISKLEEAIDEKNSQIQSLTMTGGIILIGILFAGMLFLRFRRKKPQ